MKRSTIGLKLLSELMKNSKRSDRELAKLVGVSQPTVTRTRTRLEKEGYIKEYTIMPDFRKLGFEIMALNLIKLKKEPTEEEYKRLREYGVEYEKKTPFALVMAMSGMGAGFDRITISFHEDYSSLMEFMKASKQNPIAEFYDYETFIISLADDHYRLLSFSTLARYLSMMKQ